MVTKDMGDTHSIRNLGVTASKGMLVKSTYPATSLPPGSHSTDDGCTDQHLQ